MGLATVNDYWMGVLLSDPVRANYIFFFKFICYMINLILKIMGKMTETREICGRLAKLNHCTPCTYSLRNSSITLICYRSMTTWQRLWFLVWHWWTEKMMILILVSKHFWFCDLIYSLKRLNYCSMNLCSLDVLNCSWNGLTWFITLSCSTISSSIWELSFSTCSLCHQA